jgi:outer membrane lipoprotein-sorting protein
MRASGLLFTIIVLLIAFRAHSQPSPDARAILQHASISMGCSAINPTTNIAVSGTLHASSVAAPMALTIITQGNSRWRSELDTPKGHKVTIVNDGNGQIQHGDGRVQKLAENNTYHQRPMHLPCLTNVSLSIGLLETNYVRTESVGADLLDVLEVLPASHSQFKTEVNRMKTTVWISRTSGYLLRLQYTNTSEQDSNDTQIVQIDYSDYRLVSGMAVPFHQITAAGQLTLDLVIDSVQVNGPPADFQLR